MKYHAPNQINVIRRLQNEARAHIEKATAAIQEADELTAELRKTCGKRFVCEGVPYKLEHAAIGFMPGNRDWLIGDSEVRVVDQL